LSSTCFASAFGSIAGATTERCFDAETFLGTAEGTFLGVLEPALGDFLVVGDLAFICWIPGGREGMSGS
jgi:hypothetical protein